MLRDNCSGGKVRFLCSFYQIHMRMCVALSPVYYHRSYCAQILLYGSPFTTTFSSYGNAKKPLSNAKNRCHRLRERFSGRTVLRRTLSHSQRFLSQNATAPVKP
jgi:hypothetical protein